MQKTQYQRLKNSLYPALYENKDSLFYYLYEKKLNQKENRKRALLKILEELGGEASFYDIVFYLISKDDADTLTELILSDKASSSKKAIMYGYDSCLKCEKDYGCKKVLTGYEGIDRIKYLLYLRFVKAKKLLRMLKLGVDAPFFKVLLSEPILMKFIANYALVVDIKNELKKEGMIKNDKTLYKGAGKYCPFDDFYRLA